MGLWLFALLAAVLSAQSNKTEAARSLQKGIEAQQHGNLQLAAEEFRRSAALDRASAEAKARLGMTYQSLGELPKAAAALEDALKIAPDLPGAGLLLGFTYLDMGKNRNAMPYLSKALDSEKELAVRILAGQRLVDAYFASGDFENGLNTIQRLRKLAPTDPDVLYTASKAYATLWNNAVELLVNTAPGSYRVHQVFAEVFEAQDRFSRCGQGVSGDHPDRTESSRSALPPGPHDPARGRYGGKRPERVSGIPEELEIRANDVPAHIEIGNINVRAQQFDEAEKEFLRALDLQPENIGALRGLAKVYLGLKQYSLALEPLERAATLAPEDETIRYDLMLAYRSLGRATEAQRAYSDLQKIKSRQQQSQARLLEQLKAPPVQTQTSRP